MLHLLRHAKTNQNSPTGIDYDRELLPRGYEQIAELKQFFAQHPIQPKHILCSSAMRTRQTLAELQDFWPSAQIQFIDELWSKDVLRGVRAPGTGLPYMVLIGVMRGRGYKDFCVIKRRKPGVIITFSSGKYERWIYTLEGSRHAEEQILAALA